MSFIERLQLNPEEKQVYSLLLGTGQLTAFEIAEHGKLHFSKVEVALSSLVNKGAAGVSEGYVKKYFVRIPLEYLAETSDKINSGIKEYLENTNTFIQSKQTEFNQLRSNMINQLNSSLAKKEEELDQQYSSVSANLQSLTNQRRENLESKSNVIKEKLTSILEEEKQFVEASIKEVLQNNVDTISAAKSAADTSLDNIRSSNSEVITSSITHVDQNVKQQSAKIDEISQALGPKIEMLEENYLSHLNEIAEVIQQNIDTTKIDVRAFNRDQSEKYVGFSTETVRKTEATIDNLTETVSGSLDELNTSLEMILNRKVEELSLQFQEAISSLNEKVSEIKQSLSNEFEQQRNNAISGTISQIKGDMNLKFTDLQNSEQTQRNNLISERDIFAQKLDSHYNEAIQSYNAKIAEIQDTAKTRLSSFKETLTSQFNGIASTIFENMNEHVQQFRDVSNQLNSNVQQSLGNEVDSLKEKWTNLSSQIETLTQENEAKISAQYQEAINMIGATTTSITSDLGNYLNQTLESSLKVTNDLVNSSKTQINDSKELIAGGLNEEVTAATGFLEETGGKFNDTANYLSTLTMKIKNDFRTLEATTKESPVPRVETTSIIGLDATISHLDRIVRNAKRSVTIMSPKPEYIPLDAVKSLPTTVRVTIVTYLDEQINREWIDSAYAAEANVEVRKFRDMGTGVSLPQFIGVERENEEVLIAATDEATQQVVGILSSSSEFAKIVSYIVIADFARGRSTQIK
ncbi:MAG: helix-turn-helix domain-containing protein [Candidatus Heimdallarchaeaceae archaeon]